MSGGQRNLSGPRSDAPVVEDDLVALPAILDLVLEVVHRPPALVVGELLEEVVIVGLRGGAERHDLGELGVEAVDDVFELSLHEVLVRIDAFV